MVPPIKVRKGKTILKEAQALSDCVVYDKILSGMILPNDYDFATKMESTRRRQRLKKAQNQVNLFLIIYTIIQYVLSNKDD